MSFDPQNPHADNPGENPGQAGNTATGPYIPGQPGTPQGGFAPQGVPPHYPAGAPQYPAGGPQYAAGGPQYAGAEQYAQQYAAPYAQQYAPQYAMAPNAPGKQGLAISSLVLGIIAAVLCLIPLVGMIAFLLAPIGFVLGVIGWRGAAKGRRAGKGKAIAGVVLAVLSMLGAILSTAVFASAVNDASKNLDKALGNSTQQVLKEDLGVKIGRYTTVNKGFGVKEGSLTVTLTNKSSAQHNFDIKVEALTSSGKRIATDSAFVSDLGAGQSDDVQLFEFASDTDAAQLGHATFNVIEASAY